MNEWKKEKYNHFNFNELEQKKKWERSERIIMTIEEVVKKNQVHHQNRFGLYYN